MRGRLSGFGREIWVCEIFSLSKYDIEFFFFFWGGGEFRVIFYYKQLLDEVFVISGIIKMWNNQDRGKRYRLKLKAEHLPSSYVAFACVESYRSLGNLALRAQPTD